MREQHRLRNVFGSKKVEVIEERKKLNIEELHELHFSQNTLWVIKSRRRRRAGRVTLTRESRSAYRALVKKPDE